jgi:hypothetical protein
MAIRRVSLRYLVTAVCLSLGAAGATFHLKHEVRSLERDLVKTRALIARERWAMQSLRADLAYLTRPERLVMQVGQLGMVPARGSRLARIDQIVPWQQLHFAQQPPMLTTLPSGTEVALRLKPMELMALAGLEGD